VAATACLAIVTFLQMELPGGPNVVSLNGGNGLLASNSLSGPWLEGFCPGYEPQQVNVWSRATLASTNRSPAH
jgi:hypothetical protein